MSKVGDVAFCVDCDAARSASLEIATAGSADAVQEPPRRVATKKDASGDALCTACLDARVQRRRAEFLSPRARSAPPEPQSAISLLSRPTVAAMQDAASAKSIGAPPRKFSRVRLERIPETSKRAASKTREMAQKRKPGRPKRGTSKNTGGTGAEVSGLKDAEAELLKLVVEHGLAAVQRMVDGLHERIRKLMK